VLPASLSAIVPEGYPYHTVKVVPSNLILPKSEFGLASVVPAPLSVI